MKKKYLQWVAIIAIVWSVFQLYQAGVEPLTSQIQRAIHVSFALALTFALVRRWEKSNNILLRNLDFVLVVLSLTSGGYVYFQAERLTSRIQFVGELTVLDYTVCVMVILLLLEASRRTVGKAMTILAVFFLVYAFAGPYFPGMLGHAGLSFKRMTEAMYFSLDGILGVPVGVATDYVFYFILFASFLEISGGGQLFIDIALKLTKRSKGGPAKAAIVASGGMGSISGSAVANVVGTGIFTIPLMKKVGFPPKFAASVEALASTGGQFLPPIMGAAAFLMADTLGIPYKEIALAALIPALIYYVMLYVTVHLQAGKIGMKASKKTDSGPEDELYQKKERILDKIHLLLPLVLLIVFIFNGNTLSLAAFWSILAIIAISYVRKSTRMGLTAILDSLINGAKQAIQVSIPCAVAGIIVGVITHSGLGLKFSSLITQWSFGSMILSCVFVAIGCIILGMGMPTTSAYIMAAILMAPSLEGLGFEPLAGHMFILYFACFSMITPPVALASYAAASIAKSDTNSTGFYAFFLSIPALLVAFSFVFNPALLLIGDPFEIVIATTTTLLGVTALSGAIIGYFIVPLKMLLRLVLVIASICLIAPNVLMSIIGLGVFIAVILFQMYLKRSQTANLANSGPVEFSR
ncbi:TRAP transporter permease [Neobacillus niacini]|uniref:TRAP transporter permease n=1 Tax=Neobacillus niacini TaxID=86668 RepID=UPI0021CB58A5|nr:TRAP transporter permease [Neobacillus niacini]MCM3766369.1 TRAP transporter permease [Neobacillus niacini]